MINVTDIMQSVRYKQKDHNEVKFSDYDIIQSLNEALRYINRSYALKNSDFLEKVKEYRLDDINAEIDKENEDIDDEEAKKPHIRMALICPMIYCLLSVLLQKKFGINCIPVMLKESLIIVSLRCLPESCMCVKM